MPLRFLLSQIDALKDSPPTVQVLAGAIGLAFGGMAVVWKWIRTVNGIEISAAIKPLQEQIAELQRQLRILQNGHQAASIECVNALDALPKTPENEQGRAFVRKAIDALAGIHSAVDA